MPVYFVEGNIGTGKSTFLSKIEELFPSDNQVIYEPVDIWTSLEDCDGTNILQHFYKDPKRYAYAFQSLAFISRMEKLNDIDLTKKNVFIERSIWSDSNIFARNCFMQGTLSDIEYKLYKRWFVWAENYVKINGKVKYIYLRCSPEVSLERTRIRNRKEESGIPIEYLTEIHQRHEEWVSEIPKDSVKIVDASVSFKDNKVFSDFFTKFMTEEEN